MDNLHHTRVSGEYDGWMENTVMPRQQRDSTNDFGSRPSLDLYSRGALSGRMEELYDNGLKERRGGYDTTRDLVDFDSTRSRDRQRARSPRQDEKYSSQYKDSGHSAGPSDGKEERTSKGARGYEYIDDSSVRKSQYSKTRDWDSDNDRRSRDHERRPYRDSSTSSLDRDDFEHRDRDRSRRRSRSRDRARRRRSRESDRDRRHRDHDRDRHRRERDRDREERDRSPKEIPWVPPPLPEHLRHLQVQLALNPADQSQQQSSSTPWVPPPAVPQVPTVQNQFQNDGSFLEMFRQQMEAGKTTKQPEVSKSSDAPSSNVSAAPTEAAPVTGPPIAATSSGLPVIAKRRISKILKTGVVKKPKKEEEEEEVSEGKGGDGWSSYMKEVQRYRANKCIENEASRPPLVK